MARAVFSLTSNRPSEQWKLGGGDYAYHFFRSAIWFTRIDHSMAEAMKELMAAS